MVHDSTFRSNDDVSIKYKIIPNYIMRIVKKLIVTKDYIIDRALVDYPWDNLDRKAF